MAYCGSYFQAQWSEVAHLIMDRVRVLFLVFLIAEGMRITFTTAASFLTITVLAVTSMMLELNVKVQRSQLT